jgi:hypothetical protein
MTPNYHSSFNQSSIGHNTRIAYYLYRYTVQRSLVPTLVRTLRRVMESEVPAKFSLPLKFEVTVSSGDNWGSLVDCTSE